MGRGICEWLHKHCTAWAAAHLPPPNPAPPTGYRLLATTCRPLPSDPGKRQLTAEHADSAESKLGRSLFSAYFAYLAVNPSSLRPAALPPCAFFTLTPLGWLTGIEVLALRESLADGH